MPPAPGQPAQSRDYDVAIHTADGQAPPSASRTQWPLQGPYLWLGFPVYQMGGPPGF